MKSYHALAWKELKAQKVTSILIMIAIVLSTMMTTVVAQSIGILNSMRKNQAASLNGNRYATFHQLTQEQKTALYGDDRLEFAGSVMTLGSAKLGNSGMSVYLREYFDDDLSVYPSLAQIKEGRLPESANEIALPEDALNFLGFTGDVGDPITLELSISLKYDDQTAFTYKADFTLSGILQSNYIGYSSGSVQGIAGLGAAKSLLPERYQLFSTDFRTKSLADFQQTVDNMAQALNVPGENIQYNWVYLSALGVPYDGSVNTGDGFPFLMVSGVLVGLLVLLAAGLVIYNILKIAVAKRVRQYGTLRALGAERGQLYRLVTFQLLLLCGVGIPIGILAGIAVSKGILSAVASFMSPSAFLVSTVDELAKQISQSGSGGFWPVLASAAVTLLFAFIAAMPAASNAARVSPTVAMSGNTVKIKRRHRTAKQIRNFEAFHARLNLRRNAGRTMITILSLIISIVVFVTLQSFTGLLDVSRDVQDMHLGDYSITNEVTGFTPENVKALRDESEVQSLATAKFKLYSQDENGSVAIDLDFQLKPAETFQIAGINQERLQELAPHLTDTGLQKLLNGKGCLVKNPMPISYGNTIMENTNFESGDEIRVNGCTMEILGIVNEAVTVNNSGFTNGVQIIVFDSVYDKLTGNDHYTEVYPTLEEGADTDSFEKKIEAFCKKAPGSTWLSYQNTDAQLAESFEQMNLLCWGLILFIGLIGVLNIINTVYTNIHTRISEIGVQRAIGMSSNSLYKTFLWEGAYYGIIAALIGAIAGYICTIFVGAATTDMIELVAVPVIPILQATIVSIAACLIATCIPLRQITKMSIVDSIETVE